MYMLIDRIVHQISPSRTPMVENSGTIHIKFAANKALFYLYLLLNFCHGLQTSKDGSYLSRHAALRAGVPDHVGALTVNRMCGSGFQVYALLVCVPCCYW